MSKFPAWLRLMRPNQWAKNLFVFAPNLFSPLAIDPTSWLLSGLAFLTFCLTASLIYVFNDYLDVEEDRAHPTKSITRPLAAGQLKLSTARMLIALLLALLVLALWLQPTMFWPVFVYLAINLTYGFLLRGIPVVDLVTISLGFVARVWAGASVIAVPLTPWILTDAFFLALYLAAMKRRHEFLLGLGHTRASLKRYSLGLINWIVGVAATGAILGYAIFAFEVRPELSLTIVFVVLGFIRFWRLANSPGSVESPTERLVRDPWMISISIAWVISCAVILLTDIL